MRQPDSSNEYSPKQANLGSDFRQLLSLRVAYYNIAWQILTAVSREQVGYARFRGRGICARLWIPTGFLGAFLLGYALDMSPHLSEVSGTTCTRIAPSGFA